MADYIITSLQSWDASFGGNAKDIAYELSRQHRVLYIKDVYKRQLLEMLTKVKIIKEK